MNKVIMIGRLTADPEGSVTQSGISKATFTLAVDRRYRNANGDKLTDFPRIVCWRQTADFVNKYIRKGRKISIVGEVQTRTYDAQDGSKRYVTEIVANEVEAQDSPKKNESSAGSTGSTGSSEPGPTPPPEGSMESQGFTEVDDDDLPFE